ncbi:hypothetical protein [Streptomyces sp. NPDC060366]|uniref:hypothetical protein n=1 Tax=Streptomyces sp. NPDC060366 TaxID=3347105 RepID=UPI003653D233
MLDRVLADEPHICAVCESPLPPTSERTCSQKRSQQLSRWNWTIEDHGLRRSSTLVEVINYRMTSAR